MRVTQTFAAIPTNPGHVLLGSNRFIKKRAGLESVANRIRDIWVENTDAVRLITRVVNVQKPLQRKPVLFYADPPYVAETRTSNKEYFHEDFNHAEFLDAVLDAPDYCKFAISGYPNELYDNRLADWHRVEFDAALKSGDLDERRTEVLWRNYPLMETTSLF